MTTEADLRFTEATGYQVAVLEVLLRSAGYDEEVSQLREIATKARMVSEAADEPR